MLLSRHSARPAIVNKCGVDSAFTRHTDGLHVFEVHGYIKNGLTLLEVSIEEEKFVSVHHRLIIVTKRMNFAYIGALLTYAWPVG